MEKIRKTRIIYSEEFKKEAVARSKIIGPKKTCGELGIVASVLQRWKKNYSNETSTNSNVLTSKPSYEELEKEFKKLKKELEYVESINLVLKKSTAIFSNSLLGNSK